VSTSERQDEEQMSRETGTRQGRPPPIGDPHRGEDPATGDPHSGEDPTEDPSLEERATQGTHTEHTQTLVTWLEGTLRPNSMRSGEQKRGAHR